MLVRICRVVLPPLILLAAILVYRLAFVSAEAPGPAFAGDAPHAIEPRYDEPLAATDEQLRAVLDRMKPAAGKANTNKLIHALRLWGPEADFGDPAIPSGARMRAYFLDDAEFRRMAGDEAPPLFTLRGGRVDVRPYEGGDPHRETSSHHDDDLLATLGEIGTPLDTPLATRDGATTVRALLASAMGRYHHRRHEYEWAAISYARYVYPVRQFKNAHGELVAVEDIVSELIEHPLHYGPCNGTHRLEALAVLYRADEEVGALSPALRRRILGHLQYMSAMLLASQTPEGYWTRRWSHGADGSKDTQAPLEDRILVTGHQLEWLALAPPEVQPPRETIIRASQWLIRQMIEVDAEKLDRHYGPFSHAARALCLWRSKDPYAAWKAGRK
jgi:hypothetical protein